MSEKHCREEGSIPLDDLPVGRWARLSDNLARNVSHRLLDLGFVPGTRLKIVRRAPLGDPVEIEIRGTRLCFRRRQLWGFRVILEDDPPAP
ncbi:MAG: FeoA domain-containing protein [Candidatus Binatia bacterium]|nr:FeoA domain-containing protein [Candidatus Binatia bacterium]